MGTPGAIDDIQPFAELSQGATTVVYKAYQKSLERFVLLKRLRPEYSHDEDLASRFKDEARIVARVHHPNVVAVYAFGGDDEGAYLVEEYVDGVDLGELVASRRVPPEVAVYILLECAKGLKSAHDRDVLHRDLKPANILISSEGEVKLTDFGLASVVGSTKEAPTELRGTLAYFAPEQILGNPVDARSDLFALGATLYEMLTGRRAFPGSNPSEIIDSVLNRDPIAILSATPGITPGLEAICAKLLARDPADRYSDGAELIAALDAYRHATDSRFGREDLKAYLGDPDAYALPAKVARMRRIPEVIVVPDMRGSVNGTGRRPHPARRVATLSAALLVAAAVFYAAIEIFGEQPDAGGREEPATQAYRALAVLPPDSVIASGGSFAEDIAEYTQMGASEDTEADDAEVDRSLTARSDREDAAEVRPERGRLAVAVDPGAAIVIDGDSIGMSSLSYPSVVELESGSHRLTLRNPRFPRYTSEVVVEPGQTTTVNVSLWSMVGRLNLKVSPWAEVYVDGRYVGQTPFSEPLILMPGAHELRLLNPGLNVDSTSTITIDRGETIDRGFILDSAR